MLGVTLLWSIAGVVTRQLESARSFEVTFWRSAFTALGLGVLLPVWGGRGSVVRAVREGDRAFWLSGVCWSVMFTAFMVALTLTTVANVLVTMSVAPLLTALIARAVLGHRMAKRTWIAILVAGVGIGWMYAHEIGGSGGGDLLGTAVALCVPIAAATNWTVLQHDRGLGENRDLLTAVLVGALLSALTTLPLSLPLAASAHDLAWLALLGIVQLAIPCLLSVVAARRLGAPEASLLALLEVVFGVAWAWLGAGETPAVHVLGGGALVLIALVGNEVDVFRRAAISA